MWRISILADFRPMGSKLSCCGILLFKSVLGHCVAVEARKLEHEKLLTWKNLALTLKQSFMKKTGSPKDGFKSFTELQIDSKQ